MSYDISNETYTSQQLRQEILILILCILLVIVGGYGIYMKFFSPESQFIADQIQTTNEPGDVIPVEELTGTVVLVGENQDYFRLAVSANQIYSIGIKSSDNAFLAAVERAPTTPVTVVVTKERSGELYDFLLQDFAFVDVSLSVPDRIKRTELENGFLNPVTQ